MEGSVFMAMLALHEDLDSQVAGNNRPLCSKVDHYWFKVAHNYEPLALQGGLWPLVQPCWA